MSEYKCLYIIIKKLYAKKQNLKILVAKLCYELLFAVFAVWRTGLVK